MNIEQVEILKTLKL